MLCLGFVLVHLGGEGRNASFIVRMVPMEWTALNAVIAVMRMAVTLPLDTAAALQGGQVSTVTACVQRDAGGQTVRYPATAKTVLPAPLMRGPVNVLLDTEAPPAKGFVPLVSSGTVAVRPARSAYTAMDPVTT